MNSIDDIELALQQLKERFIDGLPGRIEHISSHLNPQSQSDIDEMRIAVHSLKGTSGTYGLMAISQHCLLLEKLIKDFNEAACSSDEFRQQASQRIDELRDLISDVQSR